MDGLLSRLDELHTKLEWMGGGLLPPSPRGKKTHGTWKLPGDEKENICCFTSFWIYIYLSFVSRWWFRLYYVEKWHFKDWSHGSFVSATAIWHCRETSGMMPVNEQMWRCTWRTLEAAAVERSYNEVKLAEVWIKSKHSRNLRVRTHSSIIFQSTYFWKNPALQKLSDWDRYLITPQNNVFSKQNTGHLGSR